MKEVVRRGVSYVWDRRKVATTILKKPLSVSRGLYAKFLGIVFSVRRIIARKKGVTAIQEEFFSNRRLSLLATASSGCDILLTTNFDTFLILQCKNSHD